MTFEQYIAGTPMVMKAFNWLLNNNKGCTNPYHNNRHTISVARRCYELSTSQQINDSYEKCIIIASLFHDFNHVGNKSVPDSKNIEVAVNEFLEFSKSVRLDEYSIYIITIFIQSTEFPHKEIPKIQYEDIDLDITSLVNIIRDADLSQLLLEDWVEMCVYGLAKEWDISIKEQIKNQYDFFINLKYHSNVLQDIFNSQLPDKLKTLELMEKNV